MSEAIILKVKKLLALSKSSNLAEAELALSKANELISKYELEILETHDDVKDTWDFRIIDGDGNAIVYSDRLFKWENYLIQALSDLQGIRTVWYGYKSSKRLCGVGLDVDVQIVKTLFWDIAERTRELHKILKKTDKDIKLDDFGMGVAVAICTRLREEKAKYFRETISERGLRTIDNKKAEFATYYAKVSAKWRTKTNNYKTSHDTHSFNTGLRAGNEMSLPSCSKNHI